MRKLIKKARNGNVLSKLQISQGIGLDKWNTLAPLTVPTDLMQKLPSITAPYQSDSDNTNSSQTATSFNNAFQTVNSLIPNVQNSDNYNAISGGISSLGSAVGQFNPVAGAVVSGAGVTLNAVNSLFGKTTSKFSKDNQMFSLLGGSYGGTNANANKAVTDQNKKFGLFSSGAQRKAQNNILNTQEQQKTLGDIYSTSQNNMSIVNNQGDRINNRYNNQLQGYSNPISIGKRGFKFPTPEEREHINKIINLPKPEPKDVDLEEDIDISEPFDYLFTNKSIYSNTIQQGGDLYTDEANVTHFKPSEYQKLQYSKEDYEQYLSDKDIVLDYEIPEYKDGGKLNVIPDGALHARLNHMQSDSVTKKGIPVVSEQDGGIVQHAEVEKNEIIFNKEVTKEIERLHKEGTKEAAIAAGKLIALQIMENTTDNTGLLNEIE